MKETLYRVSTGLKGFFRDKLNIVIGLLIFNLFFILYVYLESCNERYHYYRNINTSLETISNKKFDVYNGAEAKELSTEEQLIRKNNRRFHLKYMFK